MSDILKILDEAQVNAARLLAHRVREGTATAADINALRAMYRDAGGSLSFRDRPTLAGNDILESFGDVDPELFN